MIDHFNRHPKTGRATELDPATFTPADEDRGMDWLFICTWGGIFTVGIGFWAGVAWLAFG